MTVLAFRVAPIATVLAILTALLFAAPANSQTEDEMTEAQAGAVYLEAICPSNEASGTYYRRVFRGKDTLHLPEIRRRLPDLRRASAAYSRSLSNTARKLFNPPAAWPADVARSVRSISNKFLGQSNAQARASTAATGTGWIDHTDRADRMEGASVRLSRRIRAILNLPSPGRGC